LEQSVPFAAPETKAGLGIDRPPQKTFAVGYIVGLIRWFSIQNGLAGAFLGTLHTSHAKIPNPEFQT
jgi:hypothetical protein